MKTLINLTVAIAFGLLTITGLLPLHSVAQAQDNGPQNSTPPTSNNGSQNSVPPITNNFVAPTVFQAAGPNAASIQGTVDAYRDKLGANNLNKVGQTDGRREINWDGGSTTNLATTKSDNPFAGFQVTRGALFTTPDGTGFVQAPPAGLAELFNNPTYATIFTAFSPSRLFSAIGGTITDVDFFVPGPDNSGNPAAVSGFGAVFTDVDQPDGSGPADKQGNRKSSTLIQYFDVNGGLLFSSFVPASPGNGSLSFFGILFPDARIARVRIISGNTVPGKNDVGKQDVVMMDDFIYGEPLSVR